MGPMNLYLWGGILVDVTVKRAVRGLLEEIIEDERYVYESGGCDSVCMMCNGISVWCQDCE